MSYPRRCATASECPVCLAPCAASCVAPCAAPCAHEINYPHRRPGRAPCRMVARWCARVRARARHAGGARRTFVRAAWRIRRARARSVHGVAAAARRRGGRGGLGTARGLRRRHAHGLQRRLSASAGGRGRETATAHLCGYARVAHGSLCGRHRHRHEPRAHAVARTLSRLHGALSERHDGIRHARGQGSARDPARAPRARDIRGRARLCTRIRLARALSPGAHRNVREHAGRAACRRPGQRGHLRGFRAGGTLPALAGRFSRPACRLRGARPYARVALRRAGVEVGAARSARPAAGGRAARSGGGRACTLARRRRAPGRRVALVQPERRRTRVAAHAAAAEGGLRHGVAAVQLHEPGPCALGHGQRLSRLSFPHPRHHLRACAVLSLDESRGRHGAWRDRACRDLGERRIDRRRHALYGVLRTLSARDGGAPRRADGALARRLHGPPHRARAARARTGGVAARGARQSGWHACSARGQPR
ncbi:hypothetical protein C7402_101606 [Paraburkholderia unamae]|uniref:Uncharacterized protein n=1 Tax=Paraburkholderia unamae TaxID=219649 RepID=A0ABX5KW47_9BURK|nr:hypothetical protein C7402_101606 [Paraburkholderia unamae]